MPPKVTCSIKNFHYELKEIIEKKTIAADVDAQALRRKYQKELIKVQEKRENLKKEIAAELKRLEDRNMVQRLLDAKGKDIEQIKAQI